jgi:hypothetical protein
VHKERQSANRGPRTTVPIAHWFNFLDIVGSPVAALLRSKDATVTQCHSRTKNIEEILISLGYLLNVTRQVKTADVFVAASEKLNALGLNLVRSLLALASTM